MGMGWGRGWGRGWGSGSGDAKTLKAELNQCRSKKPPIPPLHSILLCTFNIIVLIILIL